MLRQAAATIRMIALKELRIILGLTWRPSYSQYGEDLIAAPYLEGIKQGFYVDIGAHAPKRFSNTYYFYLRGWRGVNVDAIPGSMAAFNRTRPRDINVESAIGRENVERTLFMFDESALNTFDERVAQAVVRTGKHRVVKTVKLQMLTTQQLLDLHLPKDQAIDLLSVDVEGLEMDVLQSNDWSKYIPRVILVELNACDASGALASPVAEFLGCRGYALHAKSFNTLLFAR
jgi:hypothetical protein